MRTTFSAINNSIFLFAVCLDPIEKWDTWFHISDDHARRVSVCAARFYDGCGERACTVAFLYGLRGRRVSGPPDQGRPGFADLLDLRPQ